MSRSFRSVIALGAITMLFAVGCSDDGGETTTGQGDGETTTTGSTLAAVKARGKLNCGVNGQLDGFSLNTNGTYSGFDVDYCRAIAAAVLGDADAVNYTDLTADTRFTALQSGEIDVLIRNGTWTASRDGGLGLQWTTTTFYDGQGMLVQADSDFETLEDMDNTVVCVQSGTTTELNLATQMAKAGVKYEPLLLPDEEAISTSFTSGACDAYTTDKSGLASFRTTFPDPESLRILDVTMSKEPLGPTVREGDDKWFDVVNWTVFATIQAEEFGLNSKNIGSAEADFADNSEVLRFIGAGTGEDSTFSSGLDLPADFAVNIIGQVGSYDEIYTRNIEPLGLERGLNNLYNAEKPGLLYAPPFR